jgi:hypothetical protein
MLFRVWSVLELGRFVCWIWDFLALTSLTSELHQPYQCRAFCGCSRVLPCCSSMDQSSGARVACFVAFSSRCRWLLVPRTSSTPFAMWFWPTWVVESEKCFGSRVRLVGVSTSFEKIFYRLPFTSPSLVTRSVIQLVS